MKTAASFTICIALTLLASGCAEMSQTGSPYHPGPAAGRALGTGVGVVAGNAAGFGVGVTEGVVSGAAAPFDNTTHVVRRWHTEVTADGRTIQVPEDVLVDKYGRPVGIRTNHTNAASNVVTSPKAQ